mgnify:CR=1 FL=1
MFFLAQINISRLLKPIDDPQIAEFVNNLDRINELAESFKGFVWRLKDETGNATDIKVFDDSMIIMNMSVWKSIEELKAFAFHSDHITFMKKRNLWFEKPEMKQLALWWVKEGEFPNGEEGRKRLDYLNKHGETPYAFSFTKTFEPGKM